MFASARTSESHNPIRQSNKDDSPHDAPILPPRTILEQHPAPQAPASAPPRERSLSTPPSPPSPETAQPARKTSFSFALFREALAESTSIITSQIKRSLDAIIPSAWGKVAACTTAALGFGGLLALKPDYALGLVAISVIVRAAAFEKNHHLRAQNSIGQILFAGHAALIDAWPAVIGSGFASTRNLIQGVTPEDRPDLRLAISLVGFAIGATVFTCCIGVFPINQLSNLPLVAMSLTTAGEAFTKKWSWATRLCYLTSSSVMLPYHALMSGSLFGVLVNTLFVPNVLHSIWKHDLKPLASEAFRDSAPLPYRPLSQESSASPAYKS